MPKVNEAYYEKKKQEILEAAKRVCIKKPVYNVTMRDIVIESGMSQGGVYKYFSNIDEVFVALLNQNTLSRKVQADVNELFNLHKDPVEILDTFFQYLGKYIQKSVKGSGKIYFELTALYANEPDRFMKIKDKLQEVSNLEYLQRQLIDFLLQQVKAEKFQPIIPLEDICVFIMFAINGITQDAILAYNFSQNERLKPAPNVDRLIKALFLAICKLLGR